MYEAIHGKLKEITPAYAIIDTGAFSYYLHISLNCYTQIQDKEKVDLFLHHVVREDAQLLYGFYNNDERQVFRQLISVSGVGANTARMILSSMTSGEVKTAIVSGNVELLKGIKGIGAKSAQRIIVDLRDKVAVDEEKSDLLLATGNTIKVEALSALETLGFNKKSAEKVVNSILLKEPGQSVEELIKKSLKQL